MTPVFADTWYFLALLNPNEPKHQTAVAWSRRSMPILTKEYVLLELGNAMSPVHWRPRFIELVKSVQAHPAVTLVRGSADWLDAGLALFAQRMDKSWSLTDCISFSVMREYSIQEALTADSHFQQAGFRALLLE